MWSEQHQIWCMCIHLCFRIFVSSVVHGCVLAALSWLLRSCSTITTVSHHYFQQHQALRCFQHCLAGDHHAGGSGQRHLTDIGPPTKICVWCRSKRWRNWFVVHSDWVKIGWLSTRGSCSNHTVRSKMQRLSPKICCIFCHCWRDASILTMHQINFWLIAFFLTF